MAKKRSPQSETGGALSETLDGLGIGFLRTKADGTLQFLNASAVAILGAPEKDLVGKVALSHLLIDPEFWPNLRRATENGQAVHALVTPMRRGDGRKSWVEWSLRFHYGEGDTPAGYEGVFRDVTEQVETSREQVRLLERLSDTNAHLQTFSRLQEELLSTLGHDLKTPPGIVLGFCELILRGRYGEVRPEQNRALQAIHRNTAQLTEMLELLLDFSRFLRKTRVLTVSPYPLETILKNQLSELAECDPSCPSRFPAPALPPTAVTVAPPEVLAYLFHYLLENIVLLLHPEESCTIEVSHGDGRTQLLFRLPRLQEDRPPIGRLLSNIFVQLPTRGEDTGERRPHRLGPAAARYLALMVGATLEVAPFGQEGAELTLSLPAAAEHLVLTHEG